MENKDSWYIYNLNSITPATYTFNHTAQKPAQGSNGCLYITSTQPTNILFWQKFTLKAGESYTVDGAIKTNNVASFWAEISVGTVGPIEGQDYLPNNNGDVIQGFSTWMGCGPNVDGTFSANACTGKKTYVVPGTTGTEVDVFFCFKTGSMASPLPNPLEIWVDELKMTRSAATGNDILSLSLGTINGSSIVTPANVRAIQLISAVTVSPYATFKIMNSNNAEVAPLTLIDTTMKIVVTSESGGTKTYSITNTAPLLASESISNYSGTVTSYLNKLGDLNGICQLTITDPANPLKGSLLNLKSEDIWIYFPKIKPSVVAATIAPQILLNGAAVVIDQNVRIEQYLDGTMLISHPSTYKALQVFANDNLTGTSLQLGINTYHKAAQLGTLDNNIQSFRLKKGYMATIAQEEAGTGISQVYIAYKEDIVINKLPTNLANQVSFVRVLPWRWTGKKGWTNGVDAAQALRCNWNYDWNNEAISTLDVEYVPMRHNMNWNSYSNINNKLKSTHSLGFNEPDRTDQANISVDAAIDAWPEMLKSGLRIGSPSPSDASAGLTWLYEFIDKCDQLNYRVDFVAVHWYKGGQTARQFYDWLKAVHVRTKRPVWITEWNNGANWTCCKPTFAQQAQTIGEMINMMDTASFVERYSLYEWVENTRMMFLQSPVSLSPAGFVYRNNESPLAYNPNKVSSIVTDLQETTPEEPIAGNTLSLHPNPIEDVIRLQSSIPLLEAAVYATDGSLVKKTIILDNTINVSELPRGLYLVKLSDGETTWIRKIIKK